MSVELTDQAGVPQNGKSYHRILAPSGGIINNYQRTKCHFGWPVGADACGLIAPVQQLHFLGYYPCSKCYWPGERDALYIALGAPPDLPFPNLTVADREKRRIKT